MNSSIIAIIAITVSITIHTRDSAIKHRAHTTIIVVCTICGAE
jgi:hypothetical protein